MSLAPLIRKDLALLSRKRRWFLARSITITLLLFITIPLFLNMALTSATQTAAQLGNLVRGMFTFFVWAQFVLVLLAAPGFGTTTLSGARNNVAVDLLRLASISRPAIALAKLIGASAWPLFLAVGAAPFLALWLMWGGISGTDLVAVLGLTTSMSLAMVGLGLLSGAAASSTGGRLVAAYVLAGLYAAWGPLSAPFVSFKIRLWLHAPTALHAVMIDHPAKDQWPIAAGVAVATALAATVGVGVTLFVADFLSGRNWPGIRRRARGSRTVWGLPILWRDLRLVGTGRAGRFAVIAFLISLGLVTFALIADDSSQAFPYDDYIWGALVVSYAVLPLLVFAVTASSAIAGEKEAGTLAALLLTPGSAMRVVFSKLAGAIGRSLPLLVPPFLHAVVRIDDSQYLVMFLSVALGCFYLGAFGMVCSVVFKKSVTALVATLIGAGIQALCTCNVLTGLMLRLPKVLIGFLDGTPRFDEAVALLFSSTFYVLVICANVGAAILMFESQSRRAV